LYIVKIFAPHVDHFMQNETAQIVNYIEKLFLLELAMVHFRVNLQLLNPQKK